RTTAECGFSGVLCETLRDKTANSEGIAYYESFEIELLSKNLLKKVYVAARGDAVQVHIGAHDGSRACLNSCTKRREIDVLHPLFRNVRRVVIPSTFRGPIAGEMLQGRHERP